MTQAKCKRCEFIDQVIAEAKSLDWRLSELLDRSGMDISPCRKCGIAVISIPDGLTLCKECAEKVGE